jgi:hypothetical protein
MFLVKACRDREEGIYVEECACCVIKIATCVFVCFLIV